jgi:hypothetical protein
LYKSMIWSLLIYWLIAFEILLHITNI